MENRKYTIVIPFMWNLMFTEMIDDLLKIDTNEATPDCYPIFHEDRVKLANTLMSIILMSGYLNSLRVRFIKQRAKAEIAKRIEIEMECRVSELTALYIAIRLAQMNPNLPYYELARDIQEQMIRGSFLNGIITSVYPRLA